MAKKKVDKLTEEVAEIIDAADKGVTVFGEKIKRPLLGKPEFDLSYQEIAVRLTAAGMTEKDMAFVFGVTPKAIKERKRH